MQPDETLTSELVRRIREVAQPLRVILFGSAARGEMTSDSDVDVLVVVPDDTDPRQTTRRIYRNLIGFGVSTDVVVATCSDLDRHGANPSLIYYPALREGREIYAS